MYQKWRSCNAWLLRYGGRQTKLFVILAHFLPFFPTSNPKNQNVEKIKKKPTWDIVPEIWSRTDRSFCHLDYFLPSYHPPPLLPNNPKNQNFEKIRKTHGDSIILHMSHDFSSNKLRAASVSPVDFICSTIKHKYNDSGTKEGIWWDAEVIYADIESEDKENPYFFISYK